MITFIAECKREKEKFEELAKKCLASENKFDESCRLATELANRLDYYVETAKNRIPNYHNEIITVYKWHIRCFIDYLNSLYIMSDYN